VSNTKCPQYKKPEQQQIFAAQILDNRSDSEQLNQMELPEEVHKTEVEGILDEEPTVQDDCPEGSQFDDEKLSYEEYDSYAPPSDKEEPIYIWAINIDSELNFSVDGEQNVSVNKGLHSSVNREANSSIDPIQFDDDDWKSCQDTLRNCYQCTPYMWNDLWEFTPCNGIMHMYNCVVCANFKEHIIVSEFTNSTKDSSAWKIQDQYKQGLIQLGWDLAHEGGCLPQQEASTVKVLEQQNHQQSLWLEVACQESCSKNARIKELLEELDCECLDIELCGGKADLWLSSLLKLQDKYRELEKKLATLQPSSPSLSNVHMGLMTSEDGKSGRNKQPKGLLIDAMGNTSWDIPTRPTSLIDKLDETTHASAEEVVCIAAVRDNTNILQE